MWNPLEFIEISYHEATKIWIYHIVWKTEVPHFCLISLRTNCDYIYAPFTHLHFDSLQVIALRVLHMIMEAFGGEVGVMVMSTQRVSH